MPVSRSLPESPRASGAAAAATHAPLSLTPQAPPPVDYGYNLLQGSKAGTYSYSTHG